MATPKEVAENAIAKNTVVIFSKTWCGYCASSKKLFSKNFPDVRTQILELDERADGDDIQAHLSTIRGQNGQTQRTVPFVFVNQELVGGNSDAQAAFKAGTLTALVRGA